MTVIEALTKAEEIIGTIPVNGRENVRKMNDVFGLLDSVISALAQPPKSEGGENGDPK